MSQLGFRREAPLPKILRLSPKKLISPHAAGDSKVSSLDFFSNVDLGERHEDTRLLVDESLGINVTEVLRQAGWNVKNSSETGLTGHSDEDVFAFAHRDDRILLTHDEDFLDDRRFPPHRNPGVIVLPASGGDSVLLRVLFRALSIVGYFREIYRASKSTMTPDGILTISHRNHRTGAIERTRYRVTKNRTEEWVE